MISVIVCVSAVVLDYWLGEPPRYHPLVGFGRLAEGVESRCYGPAAAKPWDRRVRGSMALALLVAPPIAIIWALAAIPHLGVLVDIGVLYLALGAASLGRHAEAVRSALANDDLAAARERVGWIVSRDTGDLDPDQVSAAALESVLENGCDAVFGALFWYLIAGAPGVVGYRLVNTLDAMWGYRTSRYLHFGWAAARLDDGLNWLPARLTASTYMLLGRRQRAWHCWRAQAPRWSSPNAGPVMAAGAGALGVALGGSARYHGVWVGRPALGEGLAPTHYDISRAVGLVKYALGLWLAVIVAGGWLLNRGWLS